MKLKKLWFLPILLMGLMLTGCSNNKEKKAAPILTKSQVIKKSQKAFKSGQVIQSIKLSTDTSSQTVIANTSFGGNNGTIFHINNQTTNKGKTQSSEEWINMNNVFIKGGGKWYRADLDTLSGHTYAELVDAIMNNKIISDPSSTLTKAYKMSRKGQTYTLTAKINDKKIMKDACQPIANTVGQSKNQEEIFKRILQYGKYQNMTVKMIVKDNKLVNCNIFTDLKVGKYMTARFGQSYGNFGSHDFMKVPDNALNAKELPTKK